MFYLSDFYLVVCFVSNELSLKVGYYFVCVWVLHIDLDKFLVFVKGQIYRVVHWLISSFLMLYFEFSFVVCLFFLPFFLQCCLVSHWLPSEMYKHSLTTQFCPPFVKGLM